MNKATTDLQKAVRKWLKATGKDYDDGPKGAYHDLAYGGCESGMVGSLIYYHDTVKFYDKHQAEIDAMLAEFCDGCGTTPPGIFGDKWDNTDPLARDTCNKNLLAWFGFEETARYLMEE
jgi:hypothetical protein